ncbi:MAG TPA: diacylglycerol kinase family protein [Gemmatimonadaceae bacterium]
MSDRIAVILNPAAGGGRARRILGRVREAFARLGGGPVLLTERAGDERRLVRLALDAGARTIVAVGGDGTWSKVADAIAGSRADVRLALIAAGTGNDFARSLDVPARDIEQTARLAADETAERRIDLLRIDRRRHVLNVAGVGFDAVVAERVARALLPRAAAYVSSALAELFRFRGFVVAEDGVAGRHLLMLALANGRHFGGAFEIAPQAILDDGLMDVVAIGDASPLARLGLFAAALRGRHIAMPGVESRRLAALTLRFPSPPLLEVDGDLHRADAAEVVVDCLPGALRVVTPAGGSRRSPRGSAR